MRRNISIDIESEDYFCYRCEKSYTDNEGCEICGVFNKYLSCDEHGQNVRLPECMGAELK